MDVSVGANAPKGAPLSAQSVLVSYYFLPNSKTARFQICYGSEPSAIGDIWVRYVDTGGGATEWIYVGK